MSTNQKEKILERLKIQEGVEGYSNDIQDLRYLLDCIQTNNQWQAFTTVKHARYGALNYESHKFYYPAPALKLLLDNTRRAKDNALPFGNDS